MAKQARVVLNDPRFVECSARHPHLTPTGLSALSRTSLRCGGPRVSQVPEHSSTLMRVSVSSLGPRQLSPTERVLYDHRPTAVLHGARRSVAAHMDRGAVQRARRSGRRDDRRLGLRRARRSIFPLGRLSDGTLVGGSSAVQGLAQASRAMSGAAAWFRRTTACRMVAVVAVRSPSARIMLVTPRMVTKQPWALLPPRSISDR